MMNGSENISMMTHLLVFFSFFLSFFVLFVIKLNEMIKQFSLWTSLSKKRFEAIVVVIWLDMNKTELN